MDRVSGWYKRRVQMILLAIGFVMAVFLNADSINIGKALFQDDDLRTAIVQQAENFSPPPTPAPTPDCGDTSKPECSPEKLAEARDRREKEALQRVKDIRAQLNATGLPLGWIKSNDPLELRARPPVEWSWRAFELWGLKLLGLLITGFAVSQGAPFWFDLLNKFMVIRSTVKPREKSREEGSKDSTDAVSEESDLKNDADTAPSKD